MLQFFLFPGMNRADADTVYFHITVQSDYQTFSSVDVSGLKQIGSFRFHLHHYIRSFHLQASGTGDVVYK